MGSKLTIFESAESESRYNAAYSLALSLWPIPFKEQSVATSFGETHIIASGPLEAAPLVLFHPAGCGSVIWYRNVKALSQQFRIFALDTIGEVNRSTVTHPPQSREDLLQWVAEVFAALGVKRADVVGNSFGGYLSALASVYLPDLINRAVLISPAATFTPMWLWMWHFFPGYLSGSKRLKRRAYDWIWQGFPVDACIAEMRMIASTCGTPRHPGPSVLKDEELRQIQAPVLLLIGDQEVIYKPAKVIKRAKRLIGDLRVQIVPNANHNAEYTAAECVNDKMRAFLSG